MKAILSRPFVRILGILLGLIVWMANSFNPPNGYTNAPFDSSCGNCHNGGSFNGNVELSGLPGTIQANTTYNLTLTMTPTSGSPMLGGFQLVVVDNNLNDAGDLISINSETGTEFFNSREYIEHRGSKTFGGSAISWDFNWTAPATVGGGNTIRVYYIGNFTNGNGSTSGDIAFSDLDTYGFQPASSPVTATISAFQNVSCFGGTDGSVTVQASGGTPPYNYLWSNGQTTQTAVNLAAGTYTVTVTDQAGSTAATSRTLTQPTNINVLTSVSGIITCSQPTVTVSASATGGAQPYQFEWSNGANGPSTAVNTPGLYTVTLTDNNGCTKTGQITVSSNTVLPTAVATAPGPLTCAEPTITLSGQGSSPGANFIYSWSGPGIVSGANTLSPVVNQPGLYTLLVINTSNGCSSSASVTVVQNIAAPVSSTINGVLNCFQFQDTLIVSSPDTLATFSWSGPGNFSATADTIVVDTQGLYIVTVTGVNGCTVLDTAMLVLDTVAPPLTVTNGLLTCLMPTDTLIASTDSVPATIAWLSGPAGWVVVDDTVVVSQPGLYFVTATAANGCTTVDTAVVSQPAQLFANASATPETANGANDGTATVMPSGGVGPYLVFWDTGDTAQTITNLPPGTYTPTVTDANGCTVMQTVTVNAFDCVIAGNATITNVSCFGGNDGAVSLIVTTPNTPVQYLWSTNDTTQTLSGLMAGFYSITATDALGCVFVFPSILITQPAALDTTYLNSTTCDSAMAGIMKIVMSGSDGCDSIVIIEVEYDPNPYEIVLASLENDKDNAGVGSIRIEVIDGPPSLTYGWSKDGSQFPGDSASLTGLFMGLYGVTVTDPVSGCAQVFGPIEVKNAVVAVEPAHTYGIRFMPNPVTDRLTVDWGSFEPWSGRLFNSEGALVQNLESAALVNVMSFSHLPPGWYGLLVQDARGRSTLIRFSKW